MARPPRCLVQDLSAERVTLPERTAHHLRRVLRMHPGDALELVDGRGGLAHGTLAPDGAATIETREPVAAPDTAPVRLAVAPPRLPRLEWLVEKSCELGVAELALLVTRYGERDVGARRIERLQRIADEALAQCRRLHRMAVRPPATLEAVLAGAAGAALWLACPPGGPAAPASTDGTTPPPAPIRPPPGRDARPLLLLVGPEGGFERQEIDRALAAGALPVCLGSHVLRVETAALALAALAAV